MSSWIGRTLSNIRLQKLIGRDAIVETYLGSVLSSDRPVLLRIFRADLGESRDTREALKSEALALINLKHPHIIRILNFDFAEGRPYFVLDLLDGVLLSDYLQDLGERGLSLIHI